MRLAAFPTAESFGTTRLRRWPRRVQSRSVSGVRTGPTRPMPFHLQAFALRCGARRMRPMLTAVRRRLSEEPPAGRFRAFPASRDARRPSPPSRRNPDRTRTHDKLRPSEEESRGSLGSHGDLNPKDNPTAVAVSVCRPPGRTAREKARRGSVSDVRLNEEQS